MTILICLAFYTLVTSTIFATFIKPFFNFWQVNHLKYGLFIIIVKDKWIGANSSCKNCAGGKHLTQDKVQICHSRMLVPSEKQKCAILTKSYFPERTNQQLNEQWCYSEDELSQNLWWIRRMAMSMPRSLEEAWS